MEPAAIWNIECTYTAFPLAKASRGLNFLNIQITPDQRVCTILVCLYGFLPIEVSVYES